MESLEFKIHSADLLLSNFQGMQIKYALSPTKNSYKFNLKSGGSILDYRFDIFIRGEDGAFDLGVDQVGKILASVKEDVEAKVPLLINLNVSSLVFNQLIELHKSKVSPKNLTLYFEDDICDTTSHKSDVCLKTGRDLSDHVWDNLCKYRNKRDQENYLNLIDYQFNF